MASDRGQNRYSDFVALETLLRRDARGHYKITLSAQTGVRVLFCSHLINVVITGMCCYMLYIINNQRYNQNNQHIISITGFETLFELFSRNGGRNGLCVTRKELAAIRIGKIRWNKIDRVRLTLDWKLNGGHEFLSKSFFCQYRSDCVYFICSCVRFFHRKNI